MSEYYLLVKHLHISVAILSFCGFALRGFWMLRESHLLQAKPVKILPHIIDTILLLSAIYLVIASHLYPIEVNWISAKIVLLIAYIVLGTIALKRGKTKQVRIIALAFSLLVIGLIFATALIKPGLTW